MVSGRGVPSRGPLRLSPGSERQARPSDAAFMSSVNGTVTNASGSAMSSPAPASYGPCLRANERAWLAAGLIAASVTLTIVVSVL